MKRSTNMFIWALIWTIIALISLATGTEPMFVAMWLTWAVVAVMAGAIIEAIEATQ